MNKMNALIGHFLLKPFRRTRGVFRRHAFLWFRNPDYFFETFWQPIVEVLTWGFVSFYLKNASTSGLNMTGFFLGGVLLWAVFRRGQHEITFTFMEEAWSRNLQNLFITPVTMIEYFFASVVFGTVKLLLEMTLMAGLIALLFGFNVLNIGWPLIVFSLSLLLTGWAIGLFVNAAIIYFGRGLIALSWIMAFLLQPFSCVFYPLAALPPWAQKIAIFFPGTWIFEGMRASLVHHEFVLAYLLRSLGLNVVYLVAGYAVFSAVMRIARNKGLLTRLEW